VWSPGAVRYLAALGGYVLDFFDSIFSRVLIIGVLVTLVVIWARQRRTAHGDK
jgi:hypothetical protein